MSRTSSALTRGFGPVAATGALLAIAAFSISPTAAAPSAPASTTTSGTMNGAGIYGYTANTATYGEKGTQRLSVAGSYVLHPGASDSLMLGDGYYFTDKFELRGDFAFTGSPDGSTTSLSVAPVWHFPSSSCTRSNPYAGVSVGTSYWGGFDRQNFGTYGLLGGYDYFVVPNMALTAELDWQDRSLPGNYTRDLTTVWFGVTDYLNPKVSPARPEWNNHFVAPAAGAYELGFSGLVASADNESNISASLGKLLTPNFELGGEVSYADSSAGGLSGIAIVPKYYFLTDGPWRPFADLFAGVQEQRLSGASSSASNYGGQLGCQYMVNSNVALDAGLACTHLNEIGGLPAEDVTSLFLGMSAYFDTHKDQIPSHSK